jgi:hypothetical protein
MRLPHLRLREFHVHSKGTSQEVPTCEDVRVSAVLESADGAVVTRDEAVLVYHAIMRDAEELPLLIAQALRTLMSRSD